MKMQTWGLVLTLLSCGEGTRCRVSAESGHNGSISLATANAESSPVMSSFTLEDQFKESHPVRFPRKQPLILLVADKKGHEALAGWIQGLQDLGATNATIVGVADVTGVPGLFRGKVRAGFRKHYSHTVLLDWKGEVIQQLHPQPAVPNVYLVSSDGRIRMRKSGLATSEAVEELTRQLRIEAHSREQVTVETTR